MIRLQADLLPGLSPIEVTDSVHSTATEGLTELKSLSLNDLIERIAQGAVNFAINLALAIFVFYVGRFVIRKIYKLLSTIFLRRRLDKSLTTFILSLVNIVLYFILIVTVIGILGIETTSFLALFASAGVAIGMALSGTLQNFAGGVLILLLRPYRIGNYIEVQGYAGTVREIQIFFTVLNTPDNKSISIPNGSISTGSVNNWSREPLRRVSWTVAISYGDNVGAAREAILEMFAADERIKQGDNSKSDGISVVGADGEHNLTAGSKQKYHTCGDTVAVSSGMEDEECDEDNDDEENEEEGARPSFWSRLLHHGEAAKEALEKRKQRKREELTQLISQQPDYSPKVLVAELADSSVNLQIRAWTQTSEYWNVFYYYNERFYNELPLHGISFPFPQLDVHLPTKSN